MSNRLRFHRRVVDDLRAALDWYDGISPALGNRFREVIDRQLDAIELKPNGFVRAFDDIQFAPVQRFPYVILFRTVVDVIFVLGIFHAASDRSKWHDRAGDA